MRGNTVSIRGNITRDVEVKTTQSGRIVAQFGIAWNTQRKRPGTEDYESIPHYFDVKCWLTDRQAQHVTPQLLKGAPVAIVDGHLCYESWDDNGQRRSRVVIIVDDPIGGLLVGAMRTKQPGNGYQATGYQQQQAPAPYTPPQQAQQAYQPQPPQAYPAPQPLLYDEDIPF